MRACVRACVRAPVIKSHTQRLQEQHLPAPAQAQTWTPSIAIAVEAATTLSHAPLPIYLPANIEDGRHKSMALLCSTVLPMTANLSRQLLK